MMKLYGQPLGPVQANCYVCIKEGHAIVIDPGDKFPSLSKILEQENAVLDAILLTHAHFDHIGGLQYVLDEFNVPVYLSPYEFDMLKDAELNASVSFYRFIRFLDVQPVALKEGINEIGTFKVDVIFAPGHSIGSVVYIIEDTMFSGDVLFNGSIGRCDLPTGSEYAMEQSLNKLKNLEKNYTVYPGHGPATTLEEEKRHNPYLF